MKKIFVLLVLLLVIVGCGSNGTQEDRVYKVGVVDTYQSTAWNYISEQAAKDGIKVEVVVVDDYPIPNRLLNSGDIDLNSFQHTIYLNQEIEDYGYEISPIAKTIIEPMGLYSQKITNLNDLPNGAVIGIPDDVTNGGRALNLLAKAGIIELDTTSDQIPNLNNIVGNSKNVEIKEVSATVLPSLLSEYDLAAINGGVAIDFGLSLENDALVSEEISLDSDNPFINVLVVRTDDLDNADLKKLVELYHSDEVKELILNETKGASIPVWE